MQNRRYGVSDLTIVFKFLLLISLNIYTNTVKSSSLGLSKIRGVKSEKQSHRDNKGEREAVQKYEVVQSETEE